MGNKILAWHFSTADCRLGYGDERKIVSGESLSVQGNVSMCGNGLHASKRIIDALRYAPGPYLWRVEVSGDVIDGGDKICGRARTALWGFDATNLLRSFARKCALDVVHLWDAPNVVIEFLKTGRDLRAAARDAATAAARDAADAAADAAAWAAADAAARDAAWAAAWAAVRDAADAAARAAARDAAWDAAWDAQSRRLESMVAAQRQAMGEK